MFKIKLANKKFYKANIDKISLRLAKLQESYKKAQKIKAKDLNRNKNVDRV